MNTTHTPGPWRTTGALVFQQINPGGRKRYVCDCYIDFGTPEQVVANARLIAAAPDLLEALERALAIDFPNVKWTRAETERSKSEWRNHARAAIAKAQGGEQ